MRLIDADEMLANGLKNKTLILKQEDMLKTHEYKMQLLFDDARTFIDSQPTIQAIPLSVIKEIRAKIMSKDGLEDALEIIDKYMMKVGG